MRRILPFIALVLVLAACHGSGDIKVSNAEHEAPALENPFVHTVYVWFKEDVTEEQRAQMYTDTEALRSIEVVKALYTGKPAATDRPIVERSYDYAIIVHFEDLAGHDAYQQHPVHLALLENHSSLWEKVMITDVEK
ncbi:MAG: Dabb family protein [Roseivirga sp.]|nr:Dabb family protein [Roseivirga sp.]